MSDNTDKLVLTEEAKAQIPAWNERWFKIILSTEPIDFERTKAALENVLERVKLRPDVNYVKCPSATMGAILVTPISVYWFHVITEVEKTKNAAYPITKNKRKDLEYRLSPKTDWNEFLNYTGFDSREQALTLKSALISRDVVYFATKALKPLPEEANYKKNLEIYEANEKLDAEINKELDDMTVAQATKLAIEMAKAFAKSETWTRILKVIAKLPKGQDNTNSSIALAAFETSVLQVEKLLGKSLREECLGEISKYQEYYNGGSEWAAWCSYLSFVRDVVGWRSPAEENYRFYEEAAIHGGPRYMHRQFILLCERARVRNIKLAQQRDQPAYIMHCDNGPAISWDCGTELWFIEGVAVDKQIVLAPETQTVEQILKEPNEEVRRIRIERFGWGRFLKEADATLLDERYNERDAQQEKLYQLQSGNIRFNCIDPSTGREYFLSLPNDVKTCAEAQHWLSCGIDQYVIHRS